MTPEDPLDAAVARLTRWQHVPTVREAPVPYAQPQSAVVVEHAPLLQQLEVAAVGAMGSHAGTVAAGLDSNRLPGNWPAIQLRDEVRRALTAWTGEPDWTGLPLHVETARWQLLRGELDHRAWNALDRTVRSWDERIRALFQPPVTVPMDAACPRCGSRWGEEPANRDRIDALAVMYHRGDAGDVQDVRAECRAPDCGATWDGRDGLRMLMEEVRQAELDAELAELVVAACWWSPPAKSRRIT